MEFEVTPAFPTLIGRFRLPDADGINQELQALIIAEEAQYPSLGRSNIGGWHSRPDFLSRRDPAVSALTAWLNWALRRMIDAGQCVQRYAVRFRVGDHLSRRRVPCTTLSP